MINKLIELLPIISCKEATRLMSLRMERRLSIKETIDLKLHLRLCDLCQTFQKQMRELRELLRRYVPQGEKVLPQAAKNQIKKALETYQ